MSKEYSIRDLARIIKTTPQTISNIERDTVEPSLTTLRKLSVVLDKPIPYLGCFESLPEDTLGQQIIKARYYRGLLAAEAALELGVDVKTISNWESDRNTPSKIIELEQFLAVLKT
ncbi:helix-turn-helix domain-containing protein [Paenibacillus woosongensis]|uniref:Helix-turn-helix domain-containing protein n=1 Tax=Paenibacillus woosongensis TaxID=307580 RepID=A0A7X2Z0V5_9BACL|nr:helix-turn-helix domain-containing protein [Paenibacillus woosongensis]